MALGLNKVSLIGNVGHDPEIRVTQQDNREFATFWFATTETWRDKNTGEKRENTEWHRIAVFGEGLVEIVRNYTKKGTKLYLEGSLRTRKFTDAATGQERHSTEVVLQGHSVLILLDSKKKDLGFSENASSPTSNGPTQNSIDDEVPF
ncbi:single-stranded DNA-binding protein [Candidatus Sneabacter namystus]|uniref:Single-stranded DNA-binding protein n=1 Tax=Candidatus Sneabacter namystus TaxID=2601646 RepID=A0A5C0UIR2_9RICK|nr:single-stranded DNA-binding protein [Candidatus Sneabacter namystus]QEK39677.1 single-stranded DNA-binding protein [Candidatus Sneabacter namystus]